MWFDRADDELTNQTMEAIRSLLPNKLIQMLELEHSVTAEEKTKPLSLGEFKEELEEYVGTLPKGIRYSTQTGMWNLDIRDGKWEWYGDDPRIEVITKMFSDGEPGIQIFVRTDDDDLGQPAVEYSKWFGLEELHTEWLGPNDEYQMNYLSGERATHYGKSNAQLFISNIYMPIVNDVLNDEEIKEYTELDYTTWDSSSHVSSYTFKYPPVQGTMTQRFTDYLEENPRRTSNQFYEDVLGRSRPRGHNNMFFAAIKDSGIVKMERKGRQFVYSLGPNYEAWTKGKLLRRGRAYGKIG